MLRNERSETYLEISETFINEKAVRRLTDGFFYASKSRILAVLRKRPMKDVNKPSNIDPKVMRLRLGLERFKGI